MRSFVMVLALYFSGCTTSYVRQVPAQEVSLDGSNFTYVISKAESDSRKRKLELQHNEPNYSGTLGDLSFMDRHLKVFGFAAKLIGNDCDHRVAKIGRIALSKDPVKDPGDPGKEHPQWATWEYQCE